ncbi:ABC transporter substrate-binding protein [Trujillonella endophytica]|uniref:Osmoprotectant transport system substrate-binding protein n=1 Tax=Trujillonella endophytica TaxID=673521 RepID=A0A1H8WHA4_9ACTN|nr:ABC transporter substrate-binding protein [Trujillella endophytica]SEP26893.1 osmoprotectant transport system substrate-binding protein [Trujillella endophytica]
MRSRALAAVLLLTAGLVGCATTEDDAPAVPAGTVRVASYDFPENQILAELYAEGLRRAGLEVAVQHGVGTREVVLPALEQGVVDVVVEYLGTAGEFFRPDADTARRGVDDLHADLAQILAPRGLTVLAAAAAEDQNGFVVLARFAAEQGISRLSDLTALAPDLTFGGPPECADRQHCLVGLRAVYGLEFGAVLSMPSRAATVDTLLAGGIDVGLLETTDPHLTDRSLLLLEDDRGLQPHENVVPIVATDVLRAAGDELAATVDGVSARLTTADLVELNRVVALDGRTPAEAAAQWWEAAG